MSKFDATAGADKKIPTEFVVDDKTFKVLRSGSSLKKIVALDTEGDRSDDPGFNIEMMYTGISYVLTDPERDPEVSTEDDKGKWRPRPEWLEENVDFERAQDFMESILPKNRGEAVPTTPGSPSAPSTVAAN